MSLCLRIKKSDGNLNIMEDKNKIKRRIKAGVLVALAYAFALLMLNGIYSKELTLFDWQVYLPAVLAVVLVYAGIQICPKECAAFFSFMAIGFALLAIGDKENPVPLVTGVIAVCAILTTIAQEMRTPKEDSSEKSDEDENPEI